MTATVFTLLSNVGAGFLCLVFVQALWHKLAAAQEFRMSLAAYELLPEWATALAAVGLTIAELAVIAAVIVPETRHPGAFGAGALLLLYGGAMAVNLLRGRADIGCGCGGPEPTLSWYLVLRNGVLAALAVATALVPATGALSLGGLAVAAACVFPLWLSYLIFDQVIGNRSLALSILE